MKSELTADRLKQVLSYNPETGQFVWIAKTHPRSNRLVGTVAGCNSHGYLVIAVDGVLRGAHRLAWLYQTGLMPKGEIDHIDGNRANNAFSNLRDVSKAVNQQNLKNANKRNRSCGLLGVSKCRDKWKAAITINGFNKHIGVYETPEAAHLAYLTAKRKHHEGCAI